MKRKRPRDEHLGRDFERDGPRRKRSRDARALEMPAHGGRDEVRGAEEVQRAGEREARDAVEYGAVPCDLRAVDAEVRGDGAVLALFGEDGLRAGFGDVLGYLSDGTGGRD